MRHSCAPTLGRTAACAALQEVERRVEKLFEGITMPKGQPTEGVLSSLWGGKGEAAPATS